MESLRFCSDRTGFPLLRLREPALETALLPCAKKQFEAFLAMPDPQFGDAWYDTVLAVNPRVSWREPPAERPERLFLTGVLPEEARAFARWLGPDFDLPTVEQWRALHQQLYQMPLDEGLLERGLADCCPAARALVGYTRDRLTGLQTVFWGDLAMLHGGLAEWVRDGQAFAGLGSPAWSMWPTIYNPQRSEDVIRPFPGRRLLAFGFRPLRPLRG